MKDKRIKIEESKKIKRLYSPLWNKNGQVQEQERFSCYLSGLIEQRTSMVEYIDELHDFIDNLLNDRQLTIPVIVLQSEQFLAYHKWYLENRSTVSDSSPEAMVKMYLVK